MKYPHAAHEAALLQKELSLWLAAVALLYLEREGTAIRQLPPKDIPLPTQPHPAVSDQLFVRGLYPTSEPRRTNNLCGFMLQSHSDVACSQQGEGERKMERESGRERESACPAEAQSLCSPFFILSLQ